MRKYFASAILGGSRHGGAGRRIRDDSTGNAGGGQEGSDQDDDQGCPTHATSGVVKSVDDSMLVVTKSGKKPQEMTFTLNANTHKRGCYRRWRAVSVRYQEEGKTHVATAVTVEQAKTHTSAKK